MTCKDCVSERPCAFKLKEMYRDKAEKCPYFKNKADFVEVVHCRDCKHRYSYEVFDRDRKENFECRGCHILHEDFGDNSFCSYGERKTVTDTNVGGKEKNDKE